MGISHPLWLLHLTCTPFKYHGYNGQSCRCWTHCFVALKIWPGSTIPSTVESIPLQWRLGVLQSSKLCSAFDSVASIQVSVYSCFLCKVIFSPFLCSQDSIFRNYYFCNFKQSHWKFCVSNICFTTSVVTDRHHDWILRFIYLDDCPRDIFAALWLWFMTRERIPATNNPANCQCNGALKPPVEAINFRVTNCTVQKRVFPQIHVHSTTSIQHIRYKTQPL